VQGSTSGGEFVFEAPESEPVGSVLYEEHLELTSKSRLSGFAGYLMPLWYSSIAAEHEAVRARAGLFDCTHMGALEVSGDDAAGFLNLLATNDIERLKVGRAQYSYILDAAGNVLDDIIVYRRRDDNFMVVVNAANEPKIKHYLNELLAIRDMRDTDAGGDCRVDIALQGPASAEVLVKLIDDPSAREGVSGLKSFALIETQVGGIDDRDAGRRNRLHRLDHRVHGGPDVLRAVRSSGAGGATVESHPGGGSAAGRAALRVGGAGQPADRGGPAALRARAGRQVRNLISPFEAGYGWAVKLRKEFFIGKAAMERIAGTYEMQVARIQLPGARGIRPVRLDDPVLDEQGVCIGWVLSNAKAGENQYALAYVDKSVAREGKSLGVQGRKQHIEKGQTAEADLTGTVVSRFARF